MAKTVRREYLLIQKLCHLKEVHGSEKGVELFKEKYGQRGVDAVFNYIVSCSTPQNYDEATARGHEGGVVIQPNAM